MWLKCVIVVFLSGAFCQNEGHLNFDMLQQLVSTVERLELKLQDIHDKVAALEASEKETTDRDQLFQVFVDIIKGEKEIQKELLDEVSLKQVETLQGLLLAEKEIQKELLDEVSSQKQVATLQGLLLAEQEIQKDLLAKVSSQKQLATLAGLLLAELVPLREVVGQTCTQNQVTSLHNSLSTELNHHRDQITNTCTKEQLTVISTELNSSIQQSTEQHSDLANRILDAIPCCSPSVWITDLGCITPVTKLMNWEQAKNNCKTLNRRLLEDITTREQIDQLQEHFAHFFDITTGPWVGVVQCAWHEGGDLIPDSSPLWVQVNDEPNRESEECGALDMHGSNTGLWDTACSNSRFSFCQK